MRAPATIVFEVGMERATEGERSITFTATVGLAGSVSAAR